MKNKINGKVLLAVLFATTCFFACKKNNTNPVIKYNIGQTNLVADNASFNSAFVDASLVNAWGISIGPTGGIWISSNGKGVTTIYDKTGKTLLAPRTIPPAVAGNAGSPTGQVFNNTTDFAASKFIFADADGSITAWTSGTTALMVADRSAFGAEYTGLALGVNGGANFLFAANFKAAKIDVFDKTFTLVAGTTFTDPNMPAGFAPFNVENINGQLYISYAKQLVPANIFDQKGAGNGYVDIFTTNGTFVSRFASQGSLNSPWGIALAPTGFADSQASILVSNFGDGRVNIFDLQGNYKGQLQNNGQVITIDGLWAIDFLKGNVTGGSVTDPLFFTAGPAGGTHGLFGTLMKH
jgi:uncharacterized protein (TIGR03118 family)